MQIHEGYRTAERFFSSANAASYDSIVRLTTFGQDSRWKQHILNLVGEQDSILELASGTGILSSMLIRNRIAKDIMCLDLAFAYLLMAKRKAHLHYINGTAELLPYQSNHFGAVVSSYLVKYVDVSKVVEECWRVLKHDGVVVFHDFTYPTGVMSVLWNTYFQILKIAGIFARPWKDVFEELDHVIRNTKWVEQVQRQLANKGFENIACSYYTFGTSAIVYAKKP